MRYCLRSTSTHARCTRHRALFAKQAVHTQLCMIFLVYFLMHNCERYYAYSRAKSCARRLCPTCFATANTIVRCQLVCNTYDIFRDTEKFCQYIWTVWISFQCTNNLSKLLLVRKEVSLIRVVAAASTPSQVKYTHWASCCKPTTAFSVSILRAVQCT